MLGQHPPIGAPRQLGTSVSEDLPVVRRDLLPRGRRADPLLLRRLRQRGARRDACQRVESVSWLRRLERDRRSPVCGVAIDAERSTKVYCSDRCRYAGRHLSLTAGPHFRTCGINCRQYVARETAGRRQNRIISTRQIHLSKKTEARPGSGNLKVGGGWDTDRGSRLGLICGPRSRPRHWSGPPSLAVLRPAVLIWSCVKLPARSVVTEHLSNEGQAMRDIRGDLQDRASLLEEQINAHEAEFEKLIEQLKREHNSELEDLKAELEAVTRLMEVELRRLNSAPAAPTVQTGEPGGPCGASAGAAVCPGAASSASAAAAFGASAGAASGASAAAAFGASAGAASSASAATAFGA